MTMCYIKHIGCISVLYKAQTIIITLLLVAGCDQQEGKPRAKVEHALDWVKPYTKASYCPKCAPITPEQVDGIHIKDVLTLAEKQALVDWEAKQ